MHFEFLNTNNVNIYIEYLSKAVKEDIDEMMIESVNEEEIIKRVKEPFYQNTKSILAITDNKVVGRIEYHFYGCIQDGFKMAYVSFVYVLKEYRKKGIAKALFKEFEKDCFNNSINQYYLIRSSSENSRHFYNGFRDVNNSEKLILRKDIFK